MEKKKKMSSDKKFLYHGTTINHCRSVLLPEYYCTDSLVGAALYAKIRAHDWGESAIVIVYPFDKDAVNWSGVHEDISKDILGEGTTRVPIHALHYLTMDEVLKQADPLSRMVLTAEVVYSGSLSDST